MDMCINSVKETCFSQKYQKWIIDLSGFGNKLFNYNYHNYDMIYTIV